MNTFEEVDVEVEPIRKAERFRLALEVRGELTPPARLTVSEWADANRLIDPKMAVDGVGGKWRTDTTPYLRMIMDAFAVPECEELTFMKPTQIGGTEAFYNMIGFASDASPGTMLFMFADEKSARKTMEGRILPILQLSPAIRRHIVGRKDDMGMLRVSFDRMNLYPAWSNSPASAASFPCRYFLADEIDKFPRFSGREADPLKLGDERTKNFWNRFKGRASTPTTRHGYVFRAWEKSSKCRYYVACPRCGKPQTFKSHQVKFGAERDPERIRRLKLAWYECEACHAVIRDDDKPAMLAGGWWFPESAIDDDGALTGDVPATAHWGFHLNSIYSPWVTFSDYAAEFLKCGNDASQLMNFTNSWEGWIWEERVGGEATLDIVTKLQINYRAGTVPTGAVMLCAGADVHDKHIDFVIRAFGYAGESWLVMERRIELPELAANKLIPLEPLDDAVLNAVFPSAAGNGEYRVRYMAIDSGHRTDEVYQYARGRAGRVYAVKGSNERMNVPWELKKVDKSPRTNKPIPGGLVYYRFDTQLLKDALNTDRNAQPARWHLYQGVSPDYLREITSLERIIERDSKGRPVEVWAAKHGAPQEHRNDCEVYCEGIKQVFGIQLSKDAPTPVPIGQRRLVEAMTMPDGRAFLATER